MPDGFWTFTVSLHLEKDCDLVDCIKQYTKNTGCTRSELVRRALRLFFGLVSNNEESIDKNLLRVIQLEKQFKELLTAFNQLKESIYKDVDSKLSEFMKKIEEFQKELELIKKAQESIRAKAEEEKRKKEEEERERKKEIYREAVREQVIRYYDGFVEKRINDPKYRKDWVESAITRMQWFHLNDEPVDYDLLLEVLREECPELVKHFEVVLNV